MTDPDPASEPAPGPDGGAGAEWSRRGEALRRATAATTRMKPLFPPLRAGLGSEAADPLWSEVAGLVREEAAAAVSRDDYPFEDFYREDPDVVELLVARTREAVSARLPPGSAALPDVDEVVDDLVRHRLRVAPADRAGRRLTAPAPDFDVLTWAWGIRMSPIGKAEDDLLALSDQEIGYFVSRRREAVVVEMSSRSRQRWLLGNFASELDALRFVVMRIGADRRSAAGRRALGGIEPVEGMALEDGPTATHLTWSTGWADFPKGVAGRAAALSFSRVVTMLPARIAALYEGQSPTSP